MSTNGNGKVELRTIQGNRIEDMTTYPTRAEVAETLSVSVSKIRTLERKGLLHPVLDSEGTHRFHPAEVEGVHADMGGAPSADDFVQTATPAACPMCGRNQQDVSASVRLLSQVIVPREKADKYMFDVLDRQAKRIEELESQIGRAWKAREEAADFSKERAIELQAVGKDSALVDKIAERGLASVERFLSKGKAGAGGASWLGGRSREQLQTLLDVPEMWAAAELAEIRAAFDALPASPKSPPVTPPATEKDPTP